MNYKEPPALLVGPIEIAKQKDRMADALSVSQDMG
jgi:hypothetical protein